MTPELTAIENSRMRKNWGIGAGTVYEPPKRPIPARAKRRTDPKPEPVQMPVFDEALEHIAWCRDRGQIPQDVADSLSPRGRPKVASTWVQALHLVEQEIQKLRGQP